MKKLLLTVALGVIVGLSANAQGLVNFSGGTSSATRMSTNSVVGGVSTGYDLGAGSYYYALFASVANSSINGNTAAISGTNANYVINNLSGWTLVGIATNNSNAGRFSPASQGNTSANQGALNGDNSLTVSGIAGGTSVYMVTIGWLSTGIGTTVQSLQNWWAAGHSAGWIGQSAIANVTLGDGVGVATPNPFGTGTGQVGGFLVGLTPTTVPEPGTIALACLGGASLLLFRRRK